MMLTIESLDPRHFWLQLPLLTKLFVYFLCAVFVYTLFSLARVLFRLRSLRQVPRSENSNAALRMSFAYLHNRLSNLRSLLLFTFYLFALCFLLQIPGAFMVLEDSGRPLLTVILMQLAVYLEYITDVFFVFLLLHSLQWLVSARVQAFARAHELS